MEFSDVIKTGEILRKRNGDYCFSCNHCGQHFDNINEVIDHMNKVLLSNVGEEKIVFTDTEFIDVSVSFEVKCEPIGDDSNVENMDDDLDNMYDVNEVKFAEMGPLRNSNALPSLNNGDIEETADTKYHKLIENNSGSPLYTYENRAGTIQMTRIVDNNLKTPTDEDDRNDSEDSIKCCWCGESFKDFGLVHAHLTDEHNKKPSDVQSCEECRMFYKSSKLLGEHIRLHHGQDEYEKHNQRKETENSKPIECAVCHEIFYGISSFNAHTKRAHKMYRILQCYVCGIFKKKPSGLIEHLKVHDRFRKYRCYECDNIEPKITNPNDFRSHKCVLCDIWYVNHATIRSHFSDVHSQDQIYDCSICDDYSFKTEIDLKMHNVTVHKMPMDYKCKYCSKRCKSLPSLKEHHKSHSVKSNANMCNICGSKFQRKDYLSRHIKSHGEIHKDFKCYICHKQFQSNGYLKNHIKRHTEKKLHQCDVCGNRFLLAGLLRKHMKEHEGEVWKCIQCHKEFSNKSKLTAHEKTHVTERNFQCDVCFKSYKTSKNLKQHKLVHSAERRIKCRICNMTFNQGLEHMEHFRTHENGAM